MYGRQEVWWRLKSWKSYVTVTGLQGLKPSQYWLQQWPENDQISSYESLSPLSGALPNGASFSRKEWATLNRARVRVGRTTNNLYCWVLAASMACPFGEPIQTMEHILIWSRFPSSGTQDLAESASSPECQAQPHHLFRVRYCSLPIKGPSIFNSLLQSVRNITSCNVKTFKAGLDRYLTRTTNSKIYTL